VIEAMAAAAVRAGCPPDEARARAEDAFAHLEGRLVYSRLFEDSTAFQRAAPNLPANCSAVTGIAAETAGRGSGDSRREFSRRPAGRA